jgi:ATP-binding cassette subfamily F protein 3
MDQVKRLSTADEREFRKFLDDFGITKDTIRKSANILSPGERSRFELAAIMVQKPNCLILDEPTNHLDIYALDFLENAIQSYEGTVIIVTHDRYFLNRMPKYRMYQM